MCSTKRMINWLQCFCLFVMNDTTSPQLHANPSNDLPLELEFHTSNSTSTIKAPSLSLSLSPIDRSSAPHNREEMSSSEQVRASHILIKHEGSRRKSSWRDPEGRRISATKRDSAVAELKAIRDDIVAGKTRFDEVASRLSDCSSAKRGGDLGTGY